MSLVDDIVKFCKDLIVGDFENEPSNAAMVVGGLISLIPVVDQIMDVRDVSGMVYRISKKGTANCTKDDWIDLALAAFGCIPEIGSLFKTIVKPLWKGRKGLSGALRGSAFIEAMLGKAKGGAIRFMKTFNWAGNTQVAISLTMTTMDSCDMLLIKLSEPRWWVPDDLENLASTMRPRLGAARGGMRSGITQGSTALQQFVTELLGEDGYRVARLATQAATSVSTGNSPSRRNHAESRAATPRPASQQQAKHPPVGGGNTQDRSAGQGPAHRERRSTRGVFDSLEHRFKGLIGEHMAHYHHMQKVADRAWPHGVVGGNHWNGEKRLVSHANKPDSPTELVPEHFGRITSNGVDGIWSLGGGLFDFVEAKLSASSYMLFNGEFTKVESKPERHGVKKPAAKRRKVAPPPGLTERQLALWRMLGQSAKGLQMGKAWLRASLPDEGMTRSININRRHVYLFFCLPDPSGPRNYAVKPGGVVAKGAAPGIPEHMEVAAEVALRVAMGERTDDLALHNKHMPSHGISDEFGYKDIDGLDEILERLNAKGNGPRNDNPPRSGTPRRRA